MLLLLLGDRDVVAEFDEGSGARLLCQLGACGLPAPEAYKPQLKLPTRHAWRGRTPLRLPPSSPLIGL